MRTLLAFVIALSSLVVTSSLTYSPASGFYICSTVGSTCTVVGCSGDGCSILYNGFDITDTENGVEYTATEAGANLSISVTGATSTTAVQCQSTCECQGIFSEEGCTEIKGSIRFATDEMGDSEMTVAKTLSESSSASMVKLGGAVVLSVVLSILL